MTLPSQVLRLSRFAIVGLLIIGIVLLAWIWISGTYHQVITIREFPVLLGNIVVSSLIFIVMTLFLGIMLHSIVTKNLHGFTSCIGIVIFVALLLSGYWLIHTFDIQRQLWKCAFLPDILKVIIGLPLSIFLLIFPFWLARKVVWLSNCILYPYVFKPIEDKL